MAEIVQRLMVPDEARPFATSPAPENTALETLPRMEKPPKSTKDQGPRRRHMNR